MNKLSLPGFTAEVSLNDDTHMYSGVHKSYDLNGVIVAYDCGRVSRACDVLIMDGIISISECERILRKVKC